MFDIALYGHLIVDTIYDGNHKTMELGGLANMRRTFTKLDNNLNLGIIPTVLGEADIFINRETSTRSSKANLNINKLNFEIKDSSISHVLYINELEHTDFIQNLPGIITADCCKGKPINPNLLRYIDYLFVSDDEVSDLETLKELTKGTIILHSPDGSIIYKDGIEKHYHVDKNIKIQNANVLGAGDMFASCFLFAIYNKIENAIDYAHTTTSKLLKEMNEKI